jgi:AcrR family transcriptional regulator
VAAVGLAREGHRERLFAAMAQAIEQRGYRDTSVADVVRIARTSRRTFYEHFSDRDTCFLELFDASTDAVMRGIARGVRADASLGGQVETAVGAYLDAVAARPELFRSFTRELPALGRAAAERERAAAERFAALLIALVDSARGEHAEITARPLGRDTALVIVGGLRELTVNAFEERRDVRELRATAVAVVKAILAAAVLEQPAGALEVS